MKAFFSRFTGRLRAQSLPLMVGLVLSPLMAMGTSPLYSNTRIIAYYSSLYADTVPYLPNIDATTFVNQNIWDVYTVAPQADYALGVSIPYKTDNTLNFTNTSTMTGSIGWEFDFNGNMAANFVNDSLGTITAVDGDILNPVRSQYPATVSHLWISATNIVNKGALVSGVSGDMLLTGVNVSLARSTLEIGSGAASITPQCSQNNYALTNYDAAGGIYDEYWGTNGVTLNSLNLWNEANDSVASPSFPVNETCGRSNVLTRMSFSPVWADSLNIVASYTNIVTTNTDGVTPVTNHEPVQIFRQAVFVAVNNPYKIIPDDRFLANSDNVSNLFETITVSLTSSNSAGALYLVDAFASSTNHVYLFNETRIPGNDPLNSCANPTFRPANYSLDRADCQGTFAAGSPGFGVPATNFFYDQNFSNVLVQTTYSAYSAYVTNLTRSPLYGAVSNLPGRIIITATNLDLTKTTINNRGAAVEIQADNFEGSTGAVVSCQNLSYNLGSAAGNLNVTNLANNSSVPGLCGTLSAWSAVWTNGLITGVFTNYYFVTNTVGTNSVADLTNNVITNLAEVDFNVLLVDGTGLSSTVPVTVQDLILQSTSTNMLVSDSMNVVNTLLFGGQSLTLQGTLNLSGNLQNWNSSITPTWLYFTNNGTLSIPQNAHFGDDGPTNYAAFVNNGTISVGGGETINSVYYQSGGNGSSEVAPGGYFVTTPNGKLENASITSGQDMDFSGGFLKLDHSTLYAGNQFNFNLTNALYDSGGSANNTLTCGNGFNLPVKPAAGDLLGTAITCQAFNGAEVDYLWAGEDRGAAAAGYSNNVALGQLILSPQGSSAFPPLFHFSGASVSNALYVDLFDLSQISSNDLSSVLQMDPNIIIYYAAAKLSFTPPLLNGVSQEPEEYLNGQFGGHLQWVSSFAGPNSSVDVIINGQTYAVNRALRYSKIIDSNGNGIPNYYDSNPFSTPPVVLTGALLQTNLPPEKTFAISWMAETNIIYHVEYSSNLSSASWQSLLNYTNTTSTTSAVTVWDTNAVAGQRFYRISHP